MEEELLKASKEASLKIIELLEGGLDAHLCNYTKIGAGGDRSSVVDQLAEEIFVAHLSPFGQIISEEGGVIGEGEVKIILDPIDGSDNLLSGFPYYGASIAAKKDEVFFSFIVNFANGDYFVKTKSRYFRGSLFQSKEQEVVNNSYAKVGLFEKAYANPAIVAKLRENNLKFRSPGAVALSLAYARSVNFVLFIGPLRIYDIEAGLHQCEGLYCYYDKQRLLVAKEEEVYQKLFAIMDKKL